jgi:hypothetical protein
MLSFRGWLSSLKFLKSREDELYFVPAEYEARRVTEGIRALEVWKQSLDEAADTD